MDRLTRECLEKLELHEQGFYEGFSVLRVPGGYVYTIQTAISEEEKEYCASSVFVPD